jgi:hypothetical protein
MKMIGRIWDVVGALKKLRQGCSASLNCRSLPIVLEIGARAQHYFRLTKLP